MIDLATRLAISLLSMLACRRFRELKASFPRGTAVIFDSNPSRKKYNGHRLGACPSMLQQCAGAPENFRYARTQKQKIILTMRGSGGAGAFEPIRWIAAAAYGVILTIILIPITMLMRRLMLRAGRGLGD